VPERCDTNVDELAAAGGRLSVARTELDEALATARRAAVQAYESGTYETTIAKSIGVDRMTVRRWLGKLN